MYYSDYECPACRRVFNTEHAMHQHMIPSPKLQQSAHERSPATASISTRTATEVPACPTPYPTAGGDFTTTTGLEHLLETNACPRVHTDRDSTYRFVRSKDPQGLIAKKLLDCEVSHRHEATERAWNGYAFEFYLRTREFGCLHGLNQHLNSGAHEEKLYRCPNRNCREFKTLAAILNHLESESCGITRFQTVQNSVDRMMRGGNLLTI